MREVNNRMRRNVTRKEYKADADSAIQIMSIPMICVWIVSLLVEKSMI